MKYGKKRTQKFRMQPISIRIYPVAHPNVGFINYELITVVHIKKVLVLCCLKSSSFETHQWTSKDTAHGLQTTGSGQL
jgi:hypothetical protein